MVTVHAPPQFTPFQVLDAGQRAEAEGRYDFAVQFYRHLADHYPQTREAAVAKEALARVALLRNGGSQPAGIRQGVERNHGGLGEALVHAGMNAGMHAAPHVGMNGRRGVSIAPAGAERPPATFAVPRQRADYRTGRVLARIITWLGGAGVAIGMALTPIILFNPRLLAGVPVIGMGGAAGTAYVSVAVVGCGIFMVVMGQFMRAVFDAANASRDMAELTRARAEHDSAELRPGKTAARH